MIPLFLLAALLAAAGFTYVQESRAAARRTALAQAQALGVDPGTSLGGVPAPAFTLTDQFGRTQRLSAFRGRTVVLAFIDSRCTTTCPLTAQMLSDARTMLGGAAARVQFLAVNANPDATSVADVLAWSAQHAMNGKWLFLTGPAPRLQPIWSAYHIAVEVDKTTGAVTHTDATYIIDPAGRERYLFLTDSNFGGTLPEAHALAERVASVMPGRPSIEPIAAVQGATGGGGPAAGPFSLTALAPGGGTTQVSVGQGSGADAPHLVAFFATWCQACKEDLQALKQYHARAAVSPGLPPVVAVDLRVAEPSTGWVRQFVHAQALPFPVALDASGHVADAYGVSALPYLAVVSKRGRILWRHEGVLPLGTLLTDVRQAVAK